MSKDLLIIESDADLSGRMQETLQARGFNVATTADGKGAVDQARQARPELIVLAAELSGGQNGYLICREFKKDNGLKSIPVVIIGDPEKFDGHKKLKTRAEDYVAKPLDEDRLVDVIGGLIGLPETSVQVDESLSLSDLVDTADAPAPSEPEEISVDSEMNTHADAELDALDSAFDGMTSHEAEAPQDPMESTSLGLEAAAPEEESLVVDDQFSEQDSDGLSALNDESSSESSAFESLPSEPEPEPVRPPSKSAARPITSRFRTTPTDSSEMAQELKNLKTRLVDLEGALEEAQGRAQLHESRIQELEQELESARSDLHQARNATGKNDKEFFSLRESVNKKDKEILKLKTELHEREKEVIELKDRETQLEQQVSESQNSGSQLKTLQTKVEQLTAEKKKLEAQASSAREETRNANAQLAGLQVDLDEARNTLAQLEQMRAQAEGIDIQLQEAQSELEQARSELERARSENQSQATAFADEMAAVRRRQTELEEQSTKNEDRVGKLYARIRGDEKLREKTKKALSIALQLLDEQQTSVEEKPDEDEALA
jgi:CheY-like chemotaxis protein